jgi:hypothetical protein
VETNEYLVHESLPLARGSVLRIEDGREMLVRARDGCLWITQDRERQDMVLEAGQSFRISRGGRTLIVALRDGGVIALTSPYEECFARRIDLVTGATASAVPVYEAARGLRGAIAALRTRLMKAWVDLYAAPSRRAGNLV